MSMNIKNPEAYRLAHEVSDLTGETLTRAVTESLRERLERIRSEQRQGMAAALLVIGRDVASRLPLEQRDADSDEQLHGEDGLPR
ncbi:MAG: type II toxin-antitoxin system VapB family antitoxin [Chloroflexota bacterium]|nr:type II toxin-antitoxin system VapB family antitoxin [Chloroflexota bacterium]